MCERQYKALPSNTPPAVAWWYGLLVLLQNWTLDVSVGSVGSGEQVRRCDDDLDGLTKDGLDLSEPDSDGLLAQDSLLEGLSLRTLSQDGLDLDGLDLEALPNKTVCTLPIQLLLKMDFGSICVSGIWGLIRRSDVDLGGQL
jgi:hypothetical protein